MEFEKTGRRREGDRLMHRLDPVRGDYSLRPRPHKRSTITEDMSFIRETLLEKYRVDPYDFIGRPVMKFADGGFVRASIHGSRTYTRQMILDDSERLRRAARQGRARDNKLPLDEQQRLRKSKETADIVETVLTLGAPQIFGPNTEFVVPSEQDDWINGIDLLLVINNDEGDPIQIIALDFTSAVTRRDRQEQKQIRTLRGLARDTLSTASYVSLRLKNGETAYFTARGIPRLTFGLSPGAALQIATRAIDDRYLALEYSADCADAVGSLFVQLQAQITLAHARKKNNAAYYLEQALTNLDTYVGRPKLRMWKVAPVVQKINELTQPETMERLYEQAEQDVSRLKGRSKAADGE